jgi:hypothetical protein
MKKLGIISVVMFLVSILVLGSALFTNNGNPYSGTVMIAICVILPIIGLFTAFKSNKGTLKVVGIIGNLIVLLFSVIIPFVSTLFWNQP